MDNALWNDTALQIEEFITEVHVITILDKY